MNYQKYRTALYNLNKLPEGKSILEYLEQTYCKSSAFSSDSNYTMYRLGQKELVQVLCEDARNEFIITEEQVDE